MLKRLLNPISSAIILAGVIFFLIYQPWAAMPALGKDNLSSLYSTQLLIIIGGVIAWGLFWHVRTNRLTRNLNKKIAEHAQIEQALQALTASKDMANVELDGWRRFLQATLDALTEHIAVLDKNGVIITVNRRWRNFATENNLNAENFSVGANYLNTCLSGQTDMEAPDINFIRTGIQSILKGIQRGFNYEYPYRTANDKRWFGMHVTSFGGTGDDRFVVVTIENITARKLAEEELRLSQLVFVSSSEGILVTSAEGKIESVNPAFTAATEYTLEELIGKTPSLLKSSRQTPEFYENMWSSLARDGHWQGEIWNQRKDGDIVPQWLSINATKNDQGETTHYVALYTDISEIKLAEDRLLHLAHHDPLTGLPNRTLFQDRLSLALSHARRNKGMVALMFLDLDHFKRINDTLGHNIGDLLLQSMASRIQSCIRESDSVARMGGDEFTIILPGIKQVEDAMVVAQKIIDTMSQPFQLDKHELQCSTSIGIALFPKDGKNLDELIKSADTAMYSAKKAGRNGFHFYTEDMNLLVQEHLTIENDLRKAVVNQEFFLDYQPQVDLKTGQIIGTEALIRWRRKNNQIVPPVKFIPIAEESGLIMPIGEWALLTACKQAKAWSDAGLGSIRMAVNISARQFQQKDMMDVVAKALEISGLLPQQLELEITESLLLEHTEEALSKLNKLHEMGISLALDDFGTGYSSLSYLKRLPIHIVKIDRSFIMDIPSDPDDVELTRAIISMSHSLVLKVIAEGVETEEQNAFLKHANCDYGQGYLYSRPTTPEEIARMLKVQQ